MDQNHVEMLRDVGCWNEWRTRNNDRPDLSYANLDGWPLREVNLQGADIRGASLIKTNLQRARMKGALLNDTTLRDADLTAADLEEVNLCGADLSRTRFADANLTKADLSGAKLKGADFSRSNLQNAKGIRFDETYVRDGRLSPYANDHWSILRRSYSGSRLLFHLVLLTVSIAPFVVEMLGWNAFSSGEETVDQARSRMIDTLGRSPDRSWAVETTSSWLATLKPCLTSNCRQVRVWSVLLGGEGNSWWLWILPICVLSYNVGRGLLIWTVGALRDEEDRSGFTPHHEGIGGYGVLFWTHRIVQVLLVGNLVSLGLHLAHWLSRVVWLVSSAPFH